MLCGLLFIVHMSSIISPVSVTDQHVGRLTSPHLLMTRMMPWVNLKKETETYFSQEASLRSSNQANRTFTTRCCCPSKSDFSLQNEDSQRDLHHLFAHAIDWAQPVPAFQQQVLINPQSDGGEINQVFDESKNQFQQRWERLAASPTYSWLSRTRSYQFPWGQRWNQISIWW